MIFLGFPCNHQLLCRLHQVIWGHSGSLFRGDVTAYVLHAASMLWKTEVERKCLEVTNILSPSCACRLCLCASSFPVLGDSASFEHSLSQEGFPTVTHCIHTSLACVAGIFGLLHFYMLVLMHSFNAPREPVRWMHIIFQRNFSKVHLNLSP